jgi:ubiquinone/menaquinone biosynthesis C-methylase UbiE
MGTSLSSAGITCCGSGRIKQDARVEQKQIASVYDDIAPFYDIWGKLTESRARNRAIELADIRDGQSILEVAVGTGLAFHEIVKRNPNGANTGIDLSMGMLEKAKKRLRRIPEANYSLGTGSAFHLNVEDGSIDTLVNNYMFDLIRFEDMDKILAEFKRALKAGGKLVLVNMTEGEGFGSKLYEYIYTVSPKLMGGCRGVRLTERLLSHGFHVASREYYQQMLFPSEVILAYRSNRNMT